MAVYAVKQSNEYAYDANGNLTKDLNKKISNISYNCLNLPATVTFSDGSINVVSKGMKATKAIEVASEGIVNGSISAGSQMLQEGEVNGIDIVIDVASGYGGGRSGEYMKNRMQHSSQGKLLHREADHARRVAGDNPRKSRAERAKEATQKAESYGDKSAEFVSSFISNGGSLLIKNMFEEDDKRNW